MSINYATIFSPVIDQALVATLTSAAMQADAAEIKYEGGSTIKIATVSTTGLGNYSRTTGYPTGAVSVDWVSYTFDKDRAIRLNIDKFDVDETNFVATVANAVKNMREENTDPEIDSYRYAKVYSAVVASSLAAAAPPMEVYVPAAGDILGKLQDNMTAIQDIVGETAPLVCYMSRKAYGLLAKSDDLSRVLNAVETNINGVKTKVKGLDDMPIIPVPSSRMRTAYTYNDGASTYGIAPATGAGYINWIIAPRGALKGVVKGDEVKVIEPAVNQSFSGWSIMFRLYHTLIVLSAKIASMRISFQPATSALSVTVAKPTTLGATKATATAGEGNKLGYKLSAASIGGTALKDVHISTLALDEDDYTSAADIAGAAADQYLTVVAYNATSGLVVASYEKKLAAGDIGTGV